MKLTGLQLYGVDADRGTVMIRQGKGKKDRMVPSGQPSACIGAFGDLESAKIAAYVRQWEEQAVMIRGRRKDSHSAAR